MKRATRMTPARWQQVQDLFYEALGLTPEQRAALLSEACGDASLRAEVEALLAADADPPSIFEVAEEQTQTLHADGEAQPLNHRHDRLSIASNMGRRIGPYRLVGVLGRGGMGTVYLAQRDDIEKHVAIKLVRASLASPETVERFLRERRVLARLEHPNIARLLDAGVTDEETPYFVMDYVKGKPITDYCDRRQLGVEKRLMLFQSVCAAVHHAHQNLVIHRDLKPPNILVTDDGVTGKPVIKLLDFGIAKLMEHDDQDEGLTRTGMRLMTPEYAAPEQVRGKAATTATDVYALGVLLYELITGHRPYHLRGRSLGEIERVICEEEPKKPSAAVSMRAVQARNADLMRRRLAGDLDMICLKALAKEPSRRYASAEALCEDLARHLEGLPVMARPSTMRYRVRKFIARHRWGATAAALVALVLVAYGVTVTIQTGRIASERDRVEVALARSETVTGFMMDLFEASDPREALGDTITARELLKRGVARVEELSGQPEVKAQMLDVVGRVYQSMGQYDKAQPLLDQALALRRAVMGEEHAEVATSLHNLAELLQYKGDYAAAEPLFREALALRRRLLGTAHEDVANTINDLANVLRLQSNYDEAEPLFRDALAMRRALLGEKHRDVAESLNDLALLLWDRDRLDEAEAILREALALHPRLVGEEDLDVTSSLNNLALVLNQKGELDEAEVLFREVLAVRRRLLGEEHPAVALSLNNLAWLLYEKGDYVEAEVLMREALVLRRKSLGEDHPHVATSMSGIGLMLERKGDDEAAEVLHRNALAMARKLLPAHHPYVALFCERLALLLNGRGDYEAAEPFYLEALAINQSLLSEDHDGVQGLRTQLAEFYEAWGKPEQAARWRQHSRQTE